MEGGPGGARGETVSHLPHPLLCVKSIDKEGATTQSLLEVAECVLVQTLKVVVAIVLVLNEVRQTQHILFPSSYTLLTLLQI